MTGHCLGATPAIEAIIAIQALREQRLPATVGLETVDPDCAGVDLIAGTARPCEIEYALSDSIGFWGYHASLVFGRTGR